MQYNIHIYHVYFNRLKVTNLSIYNSDTVFNAAGMEQQSSGRLLTYLVLILSGSLSQKIQSH